MKKIINAAFIVLIPFFACEKNVEEDHEDETIDCSVIETYYTDHVAPILSSNCTGYGCHISTNLSGGLNLSTYTTVKTGLPNILDRVNREAGSVGFMPQGRTKLSNANLDTLQSFFEMECDE